VPRRAQLSAFSHIAEYIGKSLRERCDDATHEPLPERWVELIDYLNAREREQADARPHKKRPPPLAH
jgi:hypothetical protein